LTQQLKVIWLYRYSVIINKLRERKGILSNDRWMSVGFVQIRPLIIVEQFDHDYHYNLLEKIKHQHVKIIFMIQLRRL